MISFGLPSKPLTQLHWQPPFLSKRPCSWSSECINKLKPHQIGCTTATPPAQKKWHDWSLLFLTSKMTNRGLAQHLFFYLPLFLSWMPLPLLFFLLTMPAWSASLSTITWFLFKSFFRQAYSSALCPSLIQKSHSQATVMREKRHPKCPSWTLINPKKS